MITAVAVILSDPILVGRILWETLRKAPALLRAEFASAGPSIALAGADRTTSVSQPEALSLFSHPVCAEFVQSGTSMGETLGVLLAAEGGGAGLLWLAVSSNLFAGFRAATGAA